MYNVSTLKRLVWFMVFNATFNNIYIASWQSGLLMDETGVPEENHIPAARYNFITCCIEFTSPEFNWN